MFLAWWMAGAATQTPAAPSGLSVVALSSTALRLTIANGDTATSFRIERRLLPSGIFAEVAAGVTSPNDSTGLAPSSSYEFRVRGENGSGIGPYSATVIGTTNPPAAGALSNRRRPGAVISSRRRG